MPWETLRGRRPGTSTCRAQEPGLGTPVESFSAQGCLAGPGHTEQGNWATVAAPRAAPRFFQFPMPASQVAAWSDLGTYALRPPE